MRGPRKVRVFRDPKKSPNWYVEWRDEEGRRHCESCGPEEADARKRARQVRAELDRSRAASTGVPNDGLAEGSSPAAPAASAGLAGPVLQLRAVLRGSQVELPLDLFIEVGPEAIRVISQMVAEQRHG